MDQNWRHLTLAGMVSRDDDDDDMMKSRQKKGV